MMSSVVTKQTELEPKVQPVDMKLEVVLLNVSDVDRAKEFYESLGWRLDIDIAGGEFRGVQITPHNSETSIIFGKGTIPPQSGSPQTLVLAVDDLDAARNDLIARGINVSEVFHYAAGPFNNTVANPRDNWLLQEIKTRLPGREWELARTQSADGATLAELLHETAEHHDQYEKTHAEHHWWDWYAQYLSARQNGSSSEQASEAAGRYMDDVLHIPRL
jgi:predicted enzyme related to lactoylglutathione lyase